MWCPYSSEHGLNGKLVSKYKSNAAPATVNELAKLKATGEIWEGRLATSNGIISPETSPLILVVMLRGVAFKLILNQSSMA